MDEFTLTREVAASRILGRTLIIGFKLGFGDDFGSTWRNMANTASASASLELAAAWMFCKMKERVIRNDFLKIKVG